MVILSLEIAHFGKLHQTTIKFQPGINVITGENESGKTTMAHCLRGMFYDLEPEIRERYFPHEFDGTYGAKLTVEKDGEQYVITRSFLPEAPLLKVTEVVSGEEIEDPEAWLSGLLQGVDLAKFDETVFMSQDDFRRDVADYCLAEKDPEEIRRESSIRDSFAAGKEKLLKKKAELTSRIAVDIDKKTAAAKEELRINTEEIEALNAEIPGIREDFESKKTALSEESGLVERANKRHEEELEEDVTENRRKLAVQLELNAYQKAGKNVAGIVLLVASAVLLLAGGILVVTGKASMQGLSFDNPDTLVVPVFVLAAVLSLVIGIILTVIHNKKRSIEMQGIQEEETIREALTAAERRQQQYLDNKETEELKVENLEEKEALIRELEEQLLSKEARVSAGRERNSGLENELSRLAVKEEENGKLNADIQAVDLAMDSFEKLGDLRREQRLKALAEATENVLHSMNGDPTETISFTKEGFMRVKQAGSEMYLNGLSTAAMQEVLLAARLVKVNAMDQEKKMPLILDDIFAHFDEDRLNGCLNYLKEEGRQMILFTCQTRERKLL